MVNNKIFSIKNEFAPKLIIFFYLSTIFSIIYLATTLQSTAVSSFILACKRQFDACEFSFAI